MDIPKIEDFMGLVMGKEALKKAVGDKPEFDLMFDALLNDMKEKINTSVEGAENNKVEVNPIIASQGQDLNNVKSVKLEGTAEVNPNESHAKDLEYFLNMYKDFSKSNPIKSKESTLIDSVQKNTGLNNIENINKDDQMKEIYNTVEKYADKYGVDKDLILAIIKAESNFNPNASSSAGAKGLMQLMDFNSEAYGISNPYDIDQNIEGGVRHIKSYLDMFGGNVEMALMAYNGGPGNMERRGVSSPSDLYKMPGETQNYVPKVLKYYREGVF